jgi:hypothetical protein
MSYLPRHIAPVSAKPSSLAPLFDSSAKRWYSFFIGGEIVCQPSHAARISFSLRDVASTLVMSSMFKQLSGFAASRHHLPRLADTSVVSSSACFGSDGVASTSDTFNSVICRR